MGKAVATANAIPAEAAGNMEILKTLCCCLLLNHVTTSNLLPPLLRLKQPRPYASQCATTWLPTATKCCVPAFSQRNLVQHPTGTLQGAAKRPHSVFLSSAQLHPTTKIAHTWQSMRTHGPCYSWRSGSWCCAAWNTQPNRPTQLPARGARTVVCPFPTSVQNSSWYTKALAPCVPTTNQRTNTRHRACVEHQLWAHRQTAAAHWTGLQNGGWQWISARTPTPSRGTAWGPAAPSLLLSGSCCCCRTRLQSRCCCLLRPPGRMLLLLGGDSSQTGPRQQPPCSPVGPCPANCHLPWGCRRCCPSNKWWGSWGDHLAHHCL